MKATRQFLPSAISPPEVDEPSASTSPALTLSPRLTIGRWWMIVPWFERMNLWSGYSSRFEPWLMVMRSASTPVTSPAFSARMTSPVSSAARRSMPVPISGGSGFSSGTAWRCMFEPISARLASSCSRNGISAVATDQIWVGETSISSTSLGETVVSSPSRRRQRTRGPLSLPESWSISAFAWAMIRSSSCVASR